jgi:integrase
MADFCLERVQPLVEADGPPASKPTIWPRGDVDPVYPAHVLTNVNRPGICGGSRDTLAFCLPEGKPYNPERFSREFARALDRRPELPRLRLHDLRHTWATLALQAEVPLRIVSERLGHSSTAITADVYSHVTPTMQKDAAERVSGLIFGLGAS